MFVIVKDLNFMENLGRGKQPKEVEEKSGGTKSNFRIERNWNFTVKKYKISLKYQYFCLDSNANISICLE